MALQQFDFGTRRQQNSDWLADNSKGACQNAPVARSSLQPDRTRRANEAELP
jgi:hypothetical protein